VSTSRIEVGIAFPGAEGEYAGHVRVGAGAGREFQEEGEAFIARPDQGDGALVNAPGREFAFLRKSAGRKGRQGSGEKQGHAEARQEGRQANSLVEVVLGHSFYLVRMGCICTEATMEYYFGEHLRWSLGWETPNQAGAFLATLLPFAWGLITWVWGRSRRADGGTGRWIFGLLAVVLLVVESAGFYALARTYSRGALVGLAGSALVWGGLAWWRARKEGESDEAGSVIYRNLPWLLRMVMVAVCLGITGFHARLAPGHVAEDRSSLNRLVLWQGGAELVAASPLRGWGWGESGAAFMHWTQPLDRREGYLSMVNSYLTVAVEAGLPKFTGLLAVLLLPLGLAAFVVRRSGRGGAILDNLHLAAVAAWVAWLGCMIFSNLWIIRSLWIVPGGAAVAALVFSSGAGGVRVWRRGAFATAVFALGVSSLIWVAGAYWSGKAPLVFQRKADGSVLLSKAHTSDLPKARGEGAKLVVVPDTEVLGESYGQELRRWLLAKGGPEALHVFSSVGQIAPNHLSGVRGVVLCGAAASAAVDLAQAANLPPVWLLHPTLAAPQSSTSLPEGSLVSVPGIDILGQAAAWWGWAVHANPPIPVSLSSGLAVDARPRWPDLANVFAWAR
jgi:hypothetical protein